MNVKRIIVQNRFKTANVPYVSHEMENIHIILVCIALRKFTASILGSLDSIISFMSF
jgi:hypothetical protein